MSFGAATTGGLEEVRCERSGAPDWRADSPQLALTRVVSGSAIACS
jgi:hypothetical protein